MLSFMFKELRAIFSEFCYKSVQVTTNEIPEKILCLIMEDKIIESLIIMWILGIPYGPQWTNISHLAIGISLLCWLLHEIELDIIDLLPLIMKLLKDVITTFCLLINLWPLIIIILE